MFPIGNFFLAWKMLLWQNPPCSSKPTMKSMKEIGAFVREKRREQGVTQAQLAGVANTGLRFVSDLENGKGTVQLRKLLAVLAALGYGLYIGNRWEK